MWHLNPPAPFCLFRSLYDLFFFTLDTVNFHYNMSYSGSSHHALCWIPEESFNSGDLCFSLRKFPHIDSLIISSSLFSLWNSYYLDVGLPG